MKAPIVPAPSLIRYPYRSRRKAPLADALAAGWVRAGDYLFETGDVEADFVIGNPPYVRLEDIPEETAALYRDAYRPCAGRADLYVAFFEAALRS